MQFNWRGLTDRIADLAALGLPRRRDVRRPRRSRTLRLQTEALESRNMLASFPLLAAGSGGHLTSLWRHTAAPVAHHSAPAHISPTSSSQTLTSAGTFRLSAPCSGSAGATLAVGAVSIQGGTTINTGTLTLSGVNTYTGSVLVQNGSLGVGTATLAGNASTINIAANNMGTVSAVRNLTTNSTFAGTVSLTAGLNYGATSIQSSILQLSGVPSFASNISLTNSGGTLRFNPTSGLATIGTGVTVGGTGTLELAGTVSTLSPWDPTVNLVAGIPGANSQFSTTGTGEAGWIDGTGSTIVNSGATLTPNHIVQSPLLIGGTSINSGIVTIAASDASGNPFASGLPGFASSLTPVDNSLPLAPPVNSASPPSLPYYWSQPG